MQNPPTLLIMALQIKRPPGKYYALELSSNPRMKVDDNSETATVSFLWEGITASIHQPPQELLIDLTRRMQDAKPSEITGAATTIQQALKIGPLDRVFGFTGDYIEKIGFVTAKKQHGDTGITINLEWVATDQNVFQPNLQDNPTLQVLGTKELKRIEKTFGEAIQQAYNLLPVATRGFIELLATPMEYITYREEADPLTEEGGSVTLFYGTNRALDGTNQKGQRYKKRQLDDKLHLGTCTVSIPRGHAPGKMERPDVNIFNIFENSSKHIVVNNVSPLDQPDFLQLLNTQLSKEPEKNALLFVHGYRNSFEDAARRTAQLVWDLPFNGIAGFFSWPSAGLYRSYFADEARARSSVTQFVEFLEMLLLKTDVEHLHIIAHSMGSLVTTLALKEIRVSGIGATELERIKQLVLAAPDIDQEEFKNTILPHFQHLGLRRTIYASDHDGALAFSSLGRGNRLRLGQVGENRFVTAAVDTIEASNIQDADSHGYLFESSYLLSDLFHIIRHNHEPGLRRLRRREHNSLPYWVVFP